MISKIDSAPVLAPKKAKDLGKQDFFYLCMYDFQICANDSATLHRLINVHVGTHFQINLNFASTVIMNCIFFLIFHRAQISTVILLSSHRP